VIDRLKRIGLVQTAGTFFGHDKEGAARDQILRALLTGRRYYDVRLPLLGYHWLDFGINADPQNAGALVAMWDRAWRATAAALGAEARTDGSTASEPLLRVELRASQSPFRPD
jgi:hypothetical protein